MSLSLDTVITVAKIVKGAVDVYNRVNDWPAQMKKLGRRMKRLDGYLAELEELVKEKPDAAFSRLLPRQRCKVGDLLQEIRKVAKAVNDLFYRWKNDIGPWGLQFRFELVTQAYYALGSTSEEIAGLIEDLNEHLQDIHHWLTLLGLKAVLLIGEQRDAGVAPAPALGIPAKAPARAKKHGDVMNKRMPSPSPSPAPPRTDLRIIFVDTSNRARSVVGEALCKLMREWTKASKGHWRINTIHSAGLLLKDRTDVPDVEGLKRDIAGVQPPVSVALDAVFDNAAFDFPAKKDVHIAMLKKRSTGIKKDIFSKYDFILVFKSRDFENLLKIKSALVETEGAKGVTAKGKGRILHLGSYLTLDGIPREIEDPWKVGSEKKVTRADWNWKAAQIKLAVKNFLREEMQWKPPPQKASAQRLDTVAVLRQGAKPNRALAKVEVAKTEVPGQKDVEKGGEQKADKKDNVVKKDNGVKKDNVVKKDNGVKKENGVKKDVGENASKKEAAKAVGKKNDEGKLPDTKNHVDKRVVKVAADKVPAERAEEKKTGQKKAEEKKADEKKLPEKKVKLASEQELYGLI